jgi:ankyrin repeat protein
VCQNYCGQRVEIRGLNALSTAIARNNANLITKLMQLGANINLKLPCYSYFNNEWHPYHTTPLLTAVEMSRADILQLVLNFGAKTKQVELTAAGGEIGANILAEQRQDQSVIQILEKHEKQLISLKQLCRYTIRHKIITATDTNIIKNNNNYQCFNMLPLPTKLINYLKFKE